MVKGVYGCLSGGGRWKVSRVPRRKSENVVGGGGGREDKEVDLVKV